MWSGACVCVCVCVRGGGGGEDGVGVGWEVMTSQKQCLGHPLHTVHTDMISCKYADSEVH